MVCRSGKRINPVAFPRPFNQRAAAVFPSSAERRSEPPEAPASRRILVRTVATTSGARQPECRATTPPVPPCPIQFGACRPSGLTIPTWRTLPSAQLRGRNSVYRFVRKRIVSGLTSMPAGQFWRTVYSLSPSAEACGRNALDLDSQEHFRRFGFRYDNVRPRQHIPRLTPELTLA